MQRLKKLRDTLVGVLRVALLVELHLALTRLVRLVVCVNRGRNSVAEPGEDTCHYQRLAPKRESGLDAAPNAPPATSPMPLYIA